MPGPAPAVLTPVSSTGYATESSSAGIAYASDHHGAVSPRSMGGSISTSGYGSSLPPRVISPQDAKSIPQLSGHAGARGAHQQQQQQHQLQSASGHWQGAAAAPQMPEMQQYSQLSSQGVRNSWEMPYLESNHVPSGPSPQALSYQTPRVLPDSSHAAHLRGEGKMQQSPASQHAGHQMPRS